MARTQRLVNKTLLVFIPREDCIGDFVDESGRPSFNSYYKTHIIAIRKYFAESIKNYLKSKGMKNPKIKVHEYTFSEAGNRLVEFGNLSDASGGSDRDFWILDEVVFLSDFAKAIDEAEENVYNKIHIISNNSFYMWILLHKCDMSDASKEQYKEWLIKQELQANLRNNATIEITDVNLINAKHHAEKLYSYNNDKFVFPYTDAHIAILNMLEKFVQT